MSRWFAPGTWWYAFPLIVAGGPLMVVGPTVGVGSVLAGLAVLLFHRDPDREVPESGFLSPADGTVSVLREEEGSLLLARGRTAAGCWTSQPILYK